MRKFKFRLQPLLQVREHHERQRQKDYASALRLVQQQKDQLDALESDRAAQVERQRRIMTGAVDALRLRLGVRYFQKLRHDRLVAGELLGGLQSEAEARCQKLLTATTERRVLDELKERQRTRHMGETERSITKENDEIATGVYRRRRARKDSGLQAE